MRRIFSIFAVISLSIFMCTGVAYAEKKGIDRQALPRGRNILSMGHSFFVPVSWELDTLAEDLDIPNHRQFLLRGPGKRGTPGMFWEDPEKRKMGLNYLGSGKVDTLIMAYLPSGMVAVEDYQRWVDAALKKNPKLDVIIATPWAPQPHRDMKEYIHDVQKYHQSVHAIIDALREANPNTNVWCIPYNLGALELKRLFEAQQLPDARSFEDIFRDKLGHPGEILTKLSGLIWLSSIYGIDVTDIPKDKDYTTALREIAQSIVDDPKHKRYARPR